MKRKVAAAVLSISSLVVPEFASAGQAGRYPEYNQNSYYNHKGDREWRHGGERRDGYYGDKDYDRDRYDDRYYNDRYYDRDRHAGRSFAIIGGSTATGAAIGAAAGRGQGAAIGAVIGGVAGIVADQAVRHHNRDRRW